MTKRMKILLGVTAAVVVVSCGAIFALAKAGVINIKMLADEANNAQLNVFVHDANNQPIGNVEVTAQLNGSIDGQDVTSAADVTTPVPKLAGHAILNNLRPSTNYLITFNSIINGASCSQTTNIESGTNGGAKFVNYLLTCVPANYFNLTGYIKDSKTQARIGGATIRLIGGGFTTSKNDVSNDNVLYGKFTLTNIAFTSVADLVAKKFEVSASGYTPANNLTLQSFGVGSDLSSISNGSTIGGGSITLTPITGTTPTTSETVIFKGSVQEALAASNPGTIPLPPGAIRGAEVKIGTSDGTLTQITDTSGNFTFSNYPIIHPDHNVSKPSTGSLYTIRVTATGYTPYSKTLDNLGVSAVTNGSTYKINPISLTVDPNHLYIYGKVKDQNSKLVGDVTISAVYLNGTSHVWTAKSTADLQPAPVMPTAYNYMIDASLANIVNGVGNTISLTIYSMPAGYTTGSPTVQITIPPKGSPFIAKDIYVTSPSTTTNISGQVKNDLAGHHSSVRFNPGNVTSTDDTGRYSISNVPKQIVSASITDLLPGYTVQGGAIQSIDLSSAGDTFSQDFVLIPPVATATNITVCGTVTSGSGIDTKYIGDLNITFSDGTTAKYPPAVSTNISRTDTTVCPVVYNYAITLPRKAMTYQVTSVPSGYMLEDMSQKSIDLSTIVGQSKEINFALKLGSTGPVNIEIVGNVRSGSSILAGDAIDAYSLNSVNSSVTHVGPIKSTNLVTDDGVSAPHNFHFKGLLQSPQGYYVLYFHDDGPSGFGAIFGSGYKGQLIGYKDLTALGGNVYKLNNDVDLQHYGRGGWAAYIAGSLFSHQKFDYTTLFNKFFKS
ncbi:MAG: hypothetical protein NTY30_00265 [Candidatus Berkelbacteria bacterium]|nr:hypothetical protein [Candidatus Berkelbacteria bacterium]